MELKELLKNRNVQIGLAVLIGIAIGALFYPTKRIEEQIKQEYQEKLDKLTETYQEKTSELKEQISEIKEEKTELTVEMSKKVTQLTYQIKDLQSKKKETFYKIVRPDGTVEIRTYKESEVSESTKVIESVKEEFNQKISEISTKWQTIHIQRVAKLKEQFVEKEQVYLDKIAKMESKKITDINPKKYGIEVGYLTSLKYYLHVNVDVVGPIFLGVHSQSNFVDSHAVGAGLGLRF